ncbi:MAG: sialidase family protein [Crocinitomicaceae bacterium]|nr:exo-alpha-sialidase [Crocinitomicaceae bacterium]
MIKLVRFTLLLLSFSSFGQTIQYDPLAVHELKGKIVRSFTTSAFSEDQLFVGLKGSAGEAKVYVSNDNGSTWDVLNGGDALCPECSEVQSLCVPDANTIFAGTAGHGMFISKDKGKSFKEVKSCTSTDIRSIIQTGSGRLYASTGGDGILISDDNGKKWNSIHDPSLNQTLISNQLRTYPGSKSIIFAVTEKNGVYRSIDAGETWKQMLVEEGITILDIAFVENEVYAIGNDETTSYLFQSFLGDKKWSKHKLNIDSKVNCMHIVRSFKDHHFLFGSCSTGMYKSYAIENDISGYKCIELQKDDTVGVAHVYSNKKRIFNFSWGDGIKIIDREEECEVHMQSLLFASRSAESTWGVNTNCELDYFYFRLYDKWGEMIYEKEGSIKEVNEELKAKMAEFKRETHIYWIKFSFINDNKTLDLKGHVEIKD